MIGKLSYDDMLKLANELNNASNNIKSLIEENSSNVNNIQKFCEEVDSYVRFLTSSVDLYRDSDEALKLMIEKNK